MDDYVIGYKTFFKGLKNGLDGIKYEIGKPYVIDGEIQYMKNGFHLCELPEDALFFIKSFVVEVDLALVKGFGHMYSVSSHSYDDRYSTIYICEGMEILKVFKRDEIIKMGLALRCYRAEKFIQNFKLNDDEICLFKKAYAGDDDLLAFIEYYQEGKKDAFCKKKRCYGWKK